MSKKTSLGDWLRWLRIGVVILLLIAVGLLADQLLTWLERFSRLPLYLQYGLGAGGALLVLGAGAWWLLGRRRSIRAEPPAALSVDVLTERIASLGEKGALVEPARAELVELKERQAHAAPYVAFFGAVSMGKSSLIRALSADQRIAVDVRGGTTSKVDHFRWQSRRVGPVELADVPGFADPLKPELADIARDEAIRADLVVYVSDGDLTRTQAQEIDALAAFDKPMLIAVNKADRLNADERALVLTRIRERVPAVADIVLASAGHQESVVVVNADGAESALVRQRAPDIDALKALLEVRLGADPASLREARERSMLKLSEHKLNDAAKRLSASRADALIVTYTQRAMIGAMAAVAPGTDLLIQGVLATRFLTELCEAYQVDAREVEIGDLLKRLQVRARVQWAVGLSIAGNALKAFPGLGTVGGGLVHAVAYGLMFEVIGRAVADSLKERGRLQSADIVARINVSQISALAPRALELAKLLLDGKKNND